jgi:ADP-heptose:LPS heptosyltransferase
MTATPGRSANPSCTVAIITSGERATLQTAVASIQRQLSTTDELLLVFTAQNAAFPSTPQVRCEQFLRDAFDFAAARNFAVQQAHGEVVAFTDDDCIPSENWLRQIRQRLLQCDAIGGACLPARPYKFPGWWSGDIAWAVGMSTPGFLDGLEDHYPATSNLAGWREIFVKLPFAESSLTAGDSLYLAGREDAEWWRSARVGGLDVRAVPELIVYHDIDPGRLEYQYVRSRMVADGRALWSRRRSPAFAEFAAAEYVNACWARLRSIFAQKEGERARLELARQRALLQAARRDPDADSRAAAGRSRVWRLHYQALRQHAADLAYNLRKTLAPPEPLTPAPRKIFVSALTYLGDTVLLRPFIYALARSLSNAKVHVAARYPELLEDLAPNVIVSRHVEDGAYDAALVPYYSAGDTHIWRTRLARRAVTFDQEVGFSKRSDYRAAARILQKDLQAHEFQNLAHMFNIFGNTQALEPLSLPDFEGAAEELRAAVPWFGERRYVTLQTDSGWPGKDWPLDKWIELATLLDADERIACVLVSTGRSAALLSHALPNTGIHYAVVDETLSIPALALLMKHASLAIGPDSGPKHLAIAQSTPTLTLYGPTQPHRWGALHDQHKHRYVQATGARLTHAETIGLSPVHLMTLIGVDDVFEAARELLPETHSH